MTRYWYHSYVCGCEKVPTGDDFLHCRYTNGEDDSVSWKLLLPTENTRHFPWGFVQDQVSDPFVWKESTSTLLHGRYPWLEDHLAHCSSAPYDIEVWLHQRINYNPPEVLALPYRKILTLVLLSPLSWDPLTIVCEVEWTVGLFSPRQQHAFSMKLFIFVETAIISYAYFSFRNPILLNGFGLLAKNSKRSIQWYFIFLFWYGQPPYFPQAVDNKRRIRRLVMHGS